MTSTHPDFAGVDGSTMTLAPSEGGFALALAAPNGAAQRSSFAFMSDHLGTISDDADAGQGHLLRGLDDRKQCWRGLRANPFGRAIGRCRIALLLLSNG